MKFLHPTLQLLALCSSALASPCRISTSAVTTASITRTEEPTVSNTLSETVSESAATTSGLPSDSTTAEPSTTSAEPTLSSTLVSESATTTSGLPSVSTTAEASTTTAEAPTTTAEASTTTAEASTTTSDVPQQPTNLLRNPGFEDDTIAPWGRSGYFGDPTLSTSEAHRGSQSGYISAAPGGLADIGFRQILDTSLIEADKQYTFSVYAKTTLESSCSIRFVACESGTGAQTGFFSSANIPASLNEWVLATVTCTWNQARLDMGISVAVRGICEQLNLYVDDAVLVEAE